MDQNPQTAGSLESGTWHLSSTSCYGVLTDDMLGRTTDLKERRKGRKKKKKKNKKSREGGGDSYYKEVDGVGEPGVRTYLRPGATSH